MTTPTRQLQIVRAIQKKYPDVHLGGSLAVFLWGLNLDRPFTDIDLCAPSTAGMSIPTNAKDYREGSDNHDFDYGFNFQGYKIELKIDASQKSNILMHLGFAYLVTSIHVIREYKVKYASRGYEKHIKDLSRIDDFIRRKKL